MADSLSALAEALPTASASAFGHAELRERLQRTLTPRVARELWKYTPLSAFLTATSDARTVTPALEITGSHELDRAGSTERSDAPLAIDALELERFPLALAALLTTGDCLRLTIPADADVTATLRVEDGISVPLIVELAPGARLHIEERVTAEQFCNQSVFLKLSPGARVEHDRLAFGSGCCHWSLSQAFLGDSADYQLRQFLTGGARRRAETHVVLAGRDANATLTGAARVDDGEHLDQQLIIEHRAPGARSRQQFHALASGKSTTTFNGRIHIHEGCPGSDAALSNRNLALHREARINTKPELEIYTDDVRCAHGATVGKLSDESVFYLRSRGLSLEQARLMLCEAFLGECISGPLRDEAAAALLGAFHTEMPS